MFRNKRFQRLFKEGFWVVFGQLMAVIGSLVGVRLLTELVDPNVYGELAIGMTVATLINQTVLGPLGNGVIRFYAPALENEELDGYFHAVLRVIFFATGVIVLLLFFSLLGLFAAGKSKWSIIVLAGIVFAVFNGYNSILSGIQNAARQRFIVAIHQGVESWARFLIAAGLVIIFGPTSTVVMIGYAIAVILVICSQYVFFRKILSGKKQKNDNINEWRNKIWQFSWPISIFGMFTWVQLSSDRWALGLFSTTQEVGLYSVLYQIGYYPIAMISSMAMQYLSPIFFQKAGDATDRQRIAEVSNMSWKLTRLTLIITGIVLFISCIFHNYIFKVLVAEKYASVSYLLPYILLAGGLFAAGQTIALNLMSQMKTRTMLMAKIVTAIIGIAFNFGGAYWYGISGIVIAGLLFSAFYFFWIVSLASREGIKKCF